MPGWRLRSLPNAASAVLPVTNQTGYKSSSVVLALSIENALPVRGFIGFPRIHVDEDLYVVAQEGRPKVEDNLVLGLKHKAKYGAEDRHGAPLNNLTCAAVPFAPILLLSHIFAFDHPEAIEWSADRSAF